MKWNRALGLGVRALPCGDFGRVLLFFLFIRVFGVFFFGRTRIARLALASTHAAAPFFVSLSLPAPLVPRGVAAPSLFSLVGVFFSWVQVEHAAICEEYEGQMKELEEILASGPASANVSVEQLVKQVGTLFTQLTGVLRVVCVCVCVCVSLVGVIPRIEACSGRTRGDCSVLRAKEYRAGGTNVHTQQTNSPVS